MKELLQSLLGEPITHFALQGQGACNNAYYVETESGKKMIVKEERADKEFQPQNSFGVEAKVIHMLSEANLSVPTPELCFATEHPLIFGYTYIEGELLIDAWKDFSEDDKIRICEDLGRFHAELGAKLTKDMAGAAGVHINESIGLHPEVEKEYGEILAFEDIPASWKDLARRAKIIFGETANAAIFQFLHNDAHHENILVKDKKIAGIIDFGESEYGEVAKEFSRYIRDFGDDAEYITGVYEKASGHTLSRARLITNSFLSGLIDKVEDYRKGGEARSKAEEAVAWYHLRIANL